METTLPTFLVYATNASGYLKYPIVAIGATIEGPILMIAAGFLLSVEVFTFWPLFIALVMGDLIGDVIWYYVGYFFAEPIIKKHGHILSVTPELFLRAKSLFHKYHLKIMVISKVTMGFGMCLATLMAAGATRIPFVRYMAINLFGELILVSVLLSIGYTFGSLYSFIAKDLQLYFLIGIIVIASAGITVFVRFAKSEMAKL
ncbi:MAG: DedA family protein [Candidatus Vogelbacteria bacterium]|nr:DedA family protein [Candidatus Vogelbacteria bacterium]